MWLYVHVCIHMSMPRVPRSAHLMYVCMYLCMYVCICICMQYACIHMTMSKAHCMYVWYVFVCIHMSMPRVPRSAHRMYVFVCICIHMTMQKVSNMHAYLHMNVCVWLPTFAIPVVPLDWFIYVCMHARMYSMYKQRNATHAPRQRQWPSPSLSHTHTKWIRCTPCVAVGHVFRPRNTCASRHAPGHIWSILRGLSP